jgi:hypothetical protein
LGLGCRFCPWVRPRSFHSQDTFLFVLPFSITSSLIQNYGQSKIMAARPWIERAAMFDVMFRTPHTDWYPKCLLGKRVPSTNGGHLIHPASTLFSFLFFCMKHRNGLLRSLSHLNPFSFSHILYCICGARWPIEKINFYCRGQIKTSDVLPSEGTWEMRRALAVQSFVSLLLWCSLGRQKWPRHKKLCSSPEGRYGFLKWNPPFILVKWVSRSRWCDGLKTSFFCKSSKLP